MDELAQLIDDITGTAKENTSATAAEMDVRRFVVADWALEHPYQASEAVAGLLRQAPGILAGLLKDRLIITASQQVAWEGDREVLTGYYLSIYFDQMELSSIQIGLR